MNPAALHEPQPIATTAMPIATPLSGLSRRISALPPRALITLGIGTAALFAVIVAGFLWARTPDYKILFANVSDKDGGAIVAALAQMNVPYKHSEGGGAILVPSDKVHDTRLKLASQGLPKGGTVGFELMDNQKLGVTQFQEQVNYQRGLEGELSKSIMSLASVASARVHLAMPKPSVFMRDSEKPSASVLVQLHPGRNLDRAQVAGIVHLVSSSVPELPVKNVSVVDQDGTLLSQPGDSLASGRMDATQLAYVREIEANTIKRIEDILEPMLGRGNVRAQVTADLDFSQSESTAETYKPNQTPGAASIRSSQTRETGAATQAEAAGIPGAATNQPRAQPAEKSANNNPLAGATRDATVNYELDKTVKVTRQPVGTLKRLSAAVVVNHRKITQAGKVTMAPLANEELEQVNALVKEAMGFDAERKDSLNVVNTSFTVPEKEPVPEVPLWKDPSNIAIAKDVGSYAAFAIIGLFIFLTIIRPSIRAITDAPAAPLLAAPVQAEVLPPPGAPGRLNRVDSARALAKDDPKIVANVVKSWVSGNE